MYIHNKKVARIAALGAFFAICCIVYIVRLGTLELSGENIGGHKSDGTTQRSVIVQAQRGQIYDREGRVLVSNSYTYDITLDYSVFPKEESERNGVIIRVLEALTAFRGYAGFSEERYPLVGEYPNLEYSESAYDTEGNTFASLVYFIEESGLRADAVAKLRKSGYSRDEAAKEFDRDPLKYVSADGLVGYMTEEYGLLLSDGDSGTRYFSDYEVELLLMIRYSMVISGFSRANDYTFIKNVPLDTITSVLEWGLDGVWYSVSATRVYEYPGYASHILGQTGPIYAEDWEYYKAQGYNMNATVGISGCELAFEEYLRGSDGIKVIVEDKNGNVVDEYMKTEAIAGRDVYLTIDIDLQIAAEDGLKDNVAYVNGLSTGTESRAGALTAIDPSNGEVLVLASYPSFDLTTLGEDYNTLAADEALPLLNRALQGTYAPGSTFKPGVALAALCEGVVGASTLVDCEGVYRYYDSYQPKCWVYNSTSSPIKMHGPINAVEALEVSCNCYFYEVGRVMGIHSLNRYSNGYGLGLSTGIELAEAVGSLAGPAYREDYHLIDWQPTDTIAAAIGQSDNAFTPLQLSSYISTVVNYGTRYRTHLLLKVVDFATGEVVYAPEAEIMSAMELPEQHVSTVIRGMERVVSEGDTVGYFMQDVPVTVAGKTGTAQVGGNQSDNGLFVCVAPSRAPEIVVSSVVERCGGGSYAALAAARVLEEYYAPSEEVVE
ncbi:MAG: hypothetical protein E7589_02020 [Ruminococcaceae bacterium]|nr:hypothetical protein [Oscillospiraceae bacterium]